MIFQLLWKNGKLNWPNRAWTKNIKYWNYLIFSFTVKEMLHPREK